ncbi:hypothetical protein B0T16DRAFT_455371 [Cercophora newfieldiana]|uniref:Uncharacterized protein n=1 Tax=Cercophora newfieldiana TaxID=92897 RepID=A0AA40CVH3_9PEZI|nr:hypothetical protein B0T16DRAFT_455371 [Cercophora newfieldiana]
MPATNSGSSGAARGAQDDALMDIHIDVQFAKIVPESNTLEYSKKYAREPWKHCRDAPNTFLSIRFNTRDEFMQQLKSSDPAKHKRVQHEIDRIDETRLRFETYDDKKFMFNALRESQRAWRDEVAENVDDYIDETRSKDRYEHQQRDLALLGRLKRTWPLSEKEEHQSDDDRRRQPKRPEPDHGFKACAMYFRPAVDGTGWVGASAQHENFIGKFPNQKISVHQLLQRKEDNPLTKNEGGYLRYFHFPANNMSWIEQAMARFYDEPDIVHDDYKQQSKMTRAERLLCREFWRGQLHGSGGKAPVHARHMRSRCSMVPRDSSSGMMVQEVANQPSSDGQPASSEMRVPRTENNIALFLPYLHWETDSRRAKMVQAIKEAPGARAKSARKTEIDVITLMQKKAERSKSWHTKVLGTSERPRRSALGQYLIDLARVADAMDYEADEQLLRENLHRDPPLHIRRTLDQYYFLTLDDTSARDRDQVVYRETRAGRSFHSRNTRLVMVDQLWLWILDDHTIITSFPRRWVRNKPDPSGVHKCLREHLSNNPNVKSVHHLALLIVDQCSRVFFDRTKPLDQRPEVIDIFGSAIGNVTELTTIAYDVFWRNTALHSRNLHTIAEALSQPSNQKYLDINPEGTLLREAQDIAEELKMMRRVFSQQHQVVKDYRRHLGLLSGDVRYERDVLRSILASLSQSLQDPASESPVVPRRAVKQPTQFDEAVQAADILLELIDNRQAELQDLEESALRTCRQLEGLLGLKQQQASIVEAKAALRRADESVKQGRAIMAFTLVTIFFLPLGFFATFFGMNNADITGDMWMSLDQQVMYMFILSAIVITVSISIAFSPWVRTVLNFCLHVPLAYAAEYTGLRRFWKSSPLEGGKVKRRNHISMAKISRRRQEKEEARRRGQHQQEGRIGGERVDDERVYNRFRGREGRVDMMV